MKVVLQDGRMDCGICCLLSIIRFYGGEVSKEYLRKITNTNNEGVSAYNLIEGCKLLGMDAYGLNGNLEKIDINNLPCIAHVIINSNQQHFVVVYKIDDKNVTIMDPAVGKRNIPISMFKLMSSNNYIFIKIKKKLPTFQSKNIIFNLFIQYFYSNKYYFIILSGITLNLLLIEVIVSFTFKYIIEYSLNYYNGLNIIIIFYTILVINTLYFFISIIYKKILNKLVFMFDEKITFTTVEQLLSLPYFYYKNRTSGEVLSRFNDLTTVKNYIISFFLFFITDILSLIIFCCFMFRFNNRLSLFIILYFILLIIFVFIRSKSKRKKLKKIKILEDDVENYLIESIHNVDTTKSNHLEKRFSDKFLLKYRNLLNNNYSYSNHILFNNSFLKYIQNILFLIIYSYGGYLVINKKINLEDLILFISFFQLSLNIFSRLILVFEDMSSFIVSYKRICDLFTISKEDFSKNYYFKSYRLDGDILFKNLFYKVDNKILFNNLNLSIKKFDKVLLFGSSGCGKSTLVKMLLRYVEVPFSMISINNIDINHYHLDNIRKYISYISSNELLFHDSIYNNICLYKDVSSDTFLNIIKICRVDLIFGDDINNYNNLLEENGFLLSSGERQRIILARSLVRNSSIYIFDEAFNQIDIDLTNKILNDIFLYLKDKTIIVISHRNNFKKYFNRIIKLSDGEVYEK